MKAMYWYLLGMAIDLCALDLAIWYADVMSAAVLLPCMGAAFWMAMVVASRPPQQEMGWEAGLQALYAWFMGLCLDCRTDRYRGTKDGRVWE